jgi:hypothetical protein
MRGAGTLVESLADDQSAGIDDNGAHSWVGVAGQSPYCELEGTTHQRGVALVLWRADLSVGHVLPLVLGSCSGELRGANGALRSWQAEQTRRIHTAQIHTARIHLSESTLHGSTPVHKEPMT